MNQEVKQLRALVKKWEKESRRAEKFAAKYRDLLDLHLEASRGASNASEPIARTAGRAAKKTASTPPTAFKPKYPKPAKGYILDLLAQAGPLALSEIRAALIEKGFHYSQQALALSVKSLERRGQVKRRRAPSGSGAQFQYEIIKQVSEGNAL